MSKVTTLIPILGLIEDKMTENSWQENAIKNGSNACHPIIATFIGFSASPNGTVGMTRNIRNDIGFKTPIKIAWLAARKAMN